MNIVLLEPEIPANTGNIGRTCVVTGSSLHLIRPLGFEINEKTLKRAGLDYWSKLDVTVYDGYEHFRSVNAGSRIWYVTTKAERSYTEADFRPDDLLMFGKETAGIPEEILVENRDRCIRIPMIKDERSLNLSNAVAIVLYEALRQNGFEGLEDKGELHRLSWEPERSLSWKRRKKDLVVRSDLYSLRQALRSDWEIYGDSRI